jgi:AcrR family transcriptional regulator
MPKVWKNTIEEHRRAVREATVDTAAALVAKHGLRSVTMSQIAEETGIGRATLYKYFSDVESILYEWHERQISHHLHHLAEVRDRVTDPERLGTVLEAYALITHQSRKHHDTELAGLMHRQGHVARAEQQLRRLIQDLLTDAQQRGDVRDDLEAGELVTYCLHALTAASRMPSKASVLRLVEVVLAGLRPA